MRKIRFRRGFALDPAGGASDGQKLTKKLATNSLTDFFSYTNSLTIKK